MNIKKLAEIFSEKLSELLNPAWKKRTPSRREMDTLCVEYLNGIDCTIITRDEIREDLEDIINHSAQGRVCVRVGLPPALRHPFEDDEFILLVPKELAEKALILGGLPERWFPETSKI